MVLHCVLKSRNGFQHTLTVWKSNKHILGYLRSPAHAKAMKNFSKIGDEKKYGYEGDAIPSLEDALFEWDKNGRIH